METFVGKGAVQQRAWWQIGGIGLEGTPAANTLAREADLVLTVGARLTDFATASQSLFANPAVRFASVNVNPRDADRLGATGIIADARLALAALAEGAERADIRVPAQWQTHAKQVTAEWIMARAAALDPDRPFDPARAGPDVDTSTDAILTQGQVIGVLQEHARPGDVVIAAAGGPPGDLLKVWDATGGRRCHLEFGFSCMGYEIPAAIGVRLADARPGARVVSFLGDGTFLLAPTELVTAAQEGLAVTLIVPDNHGYQVIHRLQMLRSGRELPPAGDRGVATYNRACRFGLDPGALDRANAEVLGVVQIESAAAVGDAEQIAGLDGVDVLFVGPRDLSHDLGVPGDLGAAPFIEATGHVLAACRRHGKACGLLVPDGAAAARRLEQGWSFVAIGSDATLLATVVSAELGRARTPFKPQ